MIWLKSSTAADIVVGDIVTLSSPESGSITHRVINVQPVSREGYLIETKGDASLLSEQWLIKAKDVVLVVIARIPLAGSIVDFLGTLHGRVVVICLGIAALIGVCARRSRIRADAAGQKDARQ